MSCRTDGCDQAACVMAGECDWSAGDPSTFSRPQEAAVTSVHLRLTVDFERRRLDGWAELTVQRRRPDVSQLVLDTRRLEVLEVTHLETGDRLEYSLGEPVEGLGAPLTVSLPQQQQLETLTVSVRYRTGPECTALAWLQPEQTAGKQRPYVFSQCQAIHCRSMLPVQDTPSVKFPYTAELTVPAGLTALMSALRQGQEPAGDAVTFRFSQPVPVPAYLMALAVGRLESRQLGPRSHVWSEPELVGRAADEFADTELMLSTAEQLCGPYVWGQYDLLVLPPSFPYGGMENPCLTFVTPTLLAGDKSLADVVAHEIAHSWTGNLVTNRSWEHFWLNEGWTTFVERKVRGRLAGEPERHLSAALGWKALLETVRERGADSPLTRLVPRLDGVDPDDAFSTVPYEKGHALLWHLEQLVGGPDRFEPFLRAYIEKFKYGTVDTGDFRRYLTEYFAGGEVAGVDWPAWLFTPGLPPQQPRLDTSLVDACSALSRRWLDWDPAQPCPFTGHELDGFSATQLQELLSQLLEAAQTSPLSQAKLRHMDRLYSLSQRTNCELRYRWLRLAILSRCQDQLQPALSFVTEQGRMKYVRPIYRDLYSWPEARDAAVATYRANRAQMMHVAAYTVAKDLHLSE